jgi:SAM-dependent methyltransferase
MLSRFAIIVLPALSVCPGDASFRPTPATSRVTAGTMKLDPQDLEKIALDTLAFYNRNAEAFTQGTRDHDVTQNIDALLHAIETEPPYAILDFGCGPGRDLRTFRDLGHAPVGLEGSSRLAEIARANSGCEVWEQDFLKLDLPGHRFDGIFANAALFHVPSQELPRILLALHRTLRPGGILFSSNPHGHNEEGWSGGRYGTYYDLDTWRRCVSAAGFSELRHYYRPPGMPRDRQPWLATVWRAI